MFVIYAAEVVFHRDAEARARALRIQELRHERLVPEPPRVKRTPRPRAVAAWPRRVAVRAAAQPVHA